MLRGAAPAAVSALDVVAQARHGEGAAELGRLGDLHPGEEGEGDVQRGRGPGLNVIGTMPKRSPFSSSVYIVTVPPRIVDVEPGREETWPVRPALWTVIWCRSLMSTSDAVNFRTFLSVPLPVRTSTMPWYFSPRSVSRVLSSRHGSSATCGIPVSGSASASARGSGVGHGKRGLAPSGTSRSSFGPGPLTSSGSSPTSAPTSPAAS